MIEIWAPRYKDSVVLIATYRVMDGENLIRFTKARTLNGVFAVQGDIIRSCPIESNGRIDCFAVPLSLLKRVS